MNIQSQGCAGAFQEIAELFRDNRFVVLDKPPGLPVHPGPAGGRSVEDAFPHLSRRKDGPWLAHRLDADTAGCLVVALRKAPLLAAQQAFSTGQARKIYWAILDGSIRGETGTIDAPLSRVSQPKGWRIVTDPKGQPAISDWQVLGRTERLTWIEVRPRTGRTHQVRVHAATLGASILGDAQYGSAANVPLHLLARSIHLPLDPPVDATADPPAHMRSALEQCGWGR
jgi:tRNA pseudouridine32 synthase/23S rRNA pseudouridine746 synthase